jgi:hypothetical protein
MTRTEASLTEGLVAHGYFAVVSLNIQGLDFWSKIHYLTPPDKPTQLRLPSDIFPDLVPMEASGKTIVQGIVKLFTETPFEIVPAAPLEVPWHNIPPHKHKIVKEKAEKERRQQALGQP